jgi:hypothetical protein
MSTDIGNVNISLRLSLKQFSDDVKKGKNAAGEAAHGMANEFKESTGEAQASLALLSEQVGIHLPRHLRSVIVSIPGLGQALDAAFSSVAVIALLGVIGELVKKLEEYWESLGKLDAAEQKLFDDATKSAKARLGHAIDLLKAEYDLQIAQASGLDKDRLKLQLASNLVDLNKDYISGLEKEKAHAEDLLNIQKQIADEQGQKAVDAASPYGEGVDIGALLKSTKAEKQTEGTEAAIKSLREEIENAGIALQHAQAESINAGDALKDKTAAGAAAAAEKAKALAASLLTVEEGVLKLRAGLNVLGPDILKDFDPDALHRFNAELKAIGNVPPPPLPVYSGSAEEQALEKLRTDQLAAISESQKVYTSTRTAAETYADTLEKLNLLYDQGHISEETYNRATQQLALSMDTTRGLVHKFGESIGQTITQASLFGGSWIDTLKQVGLELVELILQMTLLKNISAASKAGGVGGFFASLAQGLSNSGGGHADGGDVRPGYHYTVGERGKEEFIPTVPGVIVPNGGWGGGGGTSINIQQNITTADANSFGKSQSQILSDAYRQAAVSHGRNRGRG